MKHKIKFLVLSFIFLVFAIETGYAIVNVDGTAAQRTQIASWLSSSLETTVGVDAAGNLTIGATGGNAAATRLRSMINDAATVTLEVVDNDPQVLFGAWQSSDATDAKGTTTGTQQIDVGDIDNQGNVLNSYGFTPDMVLMHEITEVYKGQKDTLNYEDAHAHGLTAENEVMAAHNTSWVFRLGAQSDGTKYYGKIKRPDGSYVIVEIDLATGHETNWYTETVPCTFQSNRLIAIADPDPQVHLLSYNYDLNHTYLAAIDTQMSRPTGVAFCANQDLWITEDLLTGPDEIRKFSKEGQLLVTITDPELINPEGIDVDNTTGDFFVAVEGKVLRFGDAGNLLGSYFTTDPSFRPTDVSVWRNYPTGGLYGDGTIYDIFVTDRATSQVYRFNVQNNMNTGTFVSVFGAGVIDSPEGIYVDDWWTVWVASTGNNSIYRFTPWGNLEPFNGNDYFIHDPSKEFLDMVKIGDEGIYVVDGTTGAGQLLLYDFNGNFVGTNRTETFQCPRSVAFSATFDTDVLIATPDPSDMIPIPTLTQWGVIILLLLVLAIGMVFLYQRQTSLAMAGVAEASSAKPKLFDRKLFARVFAVALLIGIAGLVAAYLYYGSITNADPFGTVVSAGIVAYMAHLWLLRKPEDKG